MKMCKIIKGLDKQDPLAERPITGRYRFVIRSARISDFIWTSRAPERVQEAVTSPHLNITLKSTEESRSSYRHRRGKWEKVQWINGYDGLYGLRPQR